MTFTSRICPGIAVELPVDRQTTTMPAWAGWHLIGSPSTGIFIETYQIVSVDPDIRHVRASFTKLRRSGELVRNFNPARLPS